MPKLLTRWLTPEELRLCYLIAPERLCAVLWGVESDKFTGRIQCRMLVEEEEEDSAPRPLGGRTRCVVCGARAYCGSCSGAGTTGEAPPLAGEGEVWW